jgi:hypothetical protein
MKKKSFMTLRPELFDIYGGWQQPPRALDEVGHTVEDPETITELPNGIIWNETRVTSFAGMNLGRCYKSFMVAILFTLFFKNTSCFHLIQFSFPVF